MNNIIFKIRVRIRRAFYSGELHLYPSSRTSVQQDKMVQQDAPPCLKSVQQDKKIFARRPKIYGKIDNFANFLINFQIFSKNHMVLQVSEGRAGTYRFFHIFLYGSYKPKRQKSVQKDKILFLARTHLQPDGVCLVGENVMLEASYQTDISVIARP